jgi:probable F420-dependent oxidoreductase
MKLDVHITDYDLKKVPDYARKAEALGYDCLWTVETQHDPFLPLGVAASATQSIKLGTAIAVAFPRSPMVVAYTAWDLQKGSGGRFILGLGSQVKAHNVLRFSVPFESPGPKLRETVLALRAIWKCWQDGSPLDFTGDFFSFRLMTPFFNPGPIANPQIPVFIAGVNSYMCRMAGEVCDGLHVHPFHSAKYLREAVHPEVKKGLAQLGRSRANFTFATSEFVVLSDNAAEFAANVKWAKQQIAFYASTRTYLPVLAAHGWEGISSQLHKKSMSGDWEAMAELISDEMLDTFAVIGSSDEIGKKLCARYAGLIDRFALYVPPQTNLLDECWAKLAQELASASLVSSSSA